MAQEYDLNNERQFFKAIDDKKLNVDTGGKFVIKDNEDFVATPKVTVQGSEFTVESEDTIQCSIDGGEFASMEAGTHDISEMEDLAVGPHTFTFKAKDSSDSESLTVSINMIKWGVSKTPTLTKVTTDAGILITVSSEEVTTLRYTLDGTAPDKFSKVYTAPVLFSTFGDWTIAVRAFTEYCEPSEVVSETFSYPE